jgi:hypothetical protein
MSTIALFFAPSASASGVVLLGVRLLTSARRAISSDDGRVATHYRVVQRGGAGVLRLDVGSASRAKLGTLGC